MCNVLAKNSSERKSFAKKASEHAAWQLVQLMAPTFCLLLLAPVAAKADSNTGTVLPSGPTGAVLYNGGQVTPGSSYTRVIRLQRNGSANGHLLATHEDFDAQAFPIYESDNDGLSWSSPIATVSEQHLGSGWYSSGSRSCSRCRSRWAACRPAPSCWPATRSGQTGSRSRST